MTCQAPTKRGNPCPQPVVEGLDVCRLHHPDAAARHAALSQQARNGNAKKRAKQEARAQALGAKPVSLRTREQIHTFIEAEVGALRAAGDDKRANAMARLAKCAMDLLPVAELEQTVAELKALISERHPELKAQLRKLKVVK